MSSKTTHIWKKALSNGGIAGALSILISLVGLAEKFGDTNVVKGVVTLGDFFLLLPILLVAYTTLWSNVDVPRPTLVGLSAVTGATAGVMLTLLLALGQLVDLRPMFVNASPALYSQLSRGVVLPLGYLIPPIQGLIAAMISLGIYLLPGRIRSAVIQGILWVVLVGTLRDQILLIELFKTRAISYILKTAIFASSGLSLIGALLLFAIVAGSSYYLAGRKKATTNNLPIQTRKTNRIILLVVIAVALALLPYILGIFYSEILDTTGLFIMMGLGLNIVVGFAGLLDLGYVAFYAIGAYAMGVLTSTGLGLFNLSFWQALPFALLAAWLSGILLGLPVLRMRGDYLAIVTLGFGEIVRLLALSDWLRGVLGGTQGIQSIAQPQIGGFRFNTLQELYYLILLGIALITFIAWRLKDSRLGRSWMAIREDEDVAQAMGINLVITKLLAFSTGALFAGLAGTLGAAKLTSVYPHSMTFIISINVLVLIIIGGMGSIPGVFIGALVLVGLPGLLTEFEDYRLWFYGLVLVFMMLNRPEGLLPEARRKRELHEETSALIAE